MSRDHRGHVTGVQRLSGRRRRNIHLKSSEIMSGYAQGQGAPVSQTTGIQQLLTAEKRAAEKVAAARKRKARRLKQAKEEAQAEIEAYRKERETQYKQHENKILGSKGDTEARIGESTRVKINEINVNVTATREQALQRLLQLVGNIKPEVHQNLRL